MESSFADLSIGRGEEDKICLDDVDESEDCISQDHCLVGKPIGEGRFLFQFFHGLDVKIVLDGCPWSFNNHPLLLHLLRKGEHPQRVPLNKLQFWVHIYDLPHGYISEKVGVQLGNFIGKFLEYDKSNHGAAWLSYMRIRVELDTMSPLKRWKKISQKHGEPFLVHFMYEKLGTFCFVCGLFGHTENFCKVRYESSEVEPKRDWGLFLKAPDRGGRQVVGNRWLRESPVEGSRGDTGLDGKCMGTARFTLENLATLLGGRIYRL
ncbi:hypothetical protein ACS0TY_006375 [Phlomoides rotata]